MSVYTEFPQQNKWITTIRIRRIGLDYCIDELGLDYTANDLSLSQMDLTMNLCLDDNADVDQIIRLFQKCKYPRHFRRMHLTKKSADQGYFGIRSNDILIKVYDKIAELEANDRCPAKLCGKKLVRIEVSLKREAFLEKLSLERKDKLYDMLAAGYEQAQDVLEEYLQKMFPCSGEFVSYKRAKKAIEIHIRDQQLREQMLYLLKKASRSAGLDTAVQMLRDQYKDVDHRRLKKIYETFDKLNVNVITLGQ